MAVEIIGKSEDVRRYREYLHQQGILTKRFMTAFERSGSPLAKKPDGFRIFNGGITDVFGKKTINGVETHIKKLNPDDKLYMKGIANANIVDRMDERLEPAGIDAENFMRNRVLLLDHMYASFHVIGRVISLSAEQDGVHFEAYVGDPSRAELTQQQKDARSLIAQRLLQTVSVGFIPHKVQAPTFDNEGRLQDPAVILAWELLELSVVAVPANAGSVFEVGNLGVLLNDEKRSKPRHLTSAKSSEKIDTNSKGNLTPKGVQDVNKTITLSVEEERLMEEKLLEMLDAMKGMSTIMGQVNESLKKIIDQNETIVSHLQAEYEEVEGEEEEYEEEEEGMEEDDDQEEDDAEEEDEDEDEEDDQVKELTEIIKKQGERIENLSAIMLHILEKGDKAGG